MFAGITLPLLIVFTLASSTTQDDQILLDGRTSIQIRLMPESSIIDWYDQNDLNIINNIGGQQQRKQHSKKSPYNADDRFNVKLRSLNVQTNQPNPLETIHYSRMMVDDSGYKPQSPDGIDYDPTTTMLSFWTNTTVKQIDHLGHIIEVNHTTKPGRFLGYVPPFNQNDTKGSLMIPLLDPTTDRLVGEIQIHYLIIRPITGFDPLAKEYVSIDGIHYAGHRGTGAGIREDLPEKFIENTIAAFNYVCSKKAQMIELDVQLSKDRIPIVYHDFEIQTFLINRHDDDDGRGSSVQIPLKDVAHATMQQMATNFMPNASGNRTKTEESFETLQEVLEQLTPNCGIDVEIKYPSQLKDLSMETELGIELNEYVDRILEVLFKYGQDRPMFITSFEPDLCAMIKLKQNKYHVGFLTSAYEWTNDPRSNSMDTGIAFVQSIQLKGLVPVVDAVLKQPAQRDGNGTYIDFIKQRNIGLYVWGNINSYDMVNNLTGNGVDIVIFDHIDKILP